jgi:hypothetical protein
LKDLKAKNYLFQSIDRGIIETILDKSSSKVIWDSMKNKFQGSIKVKRAQLQALRGEFEILRMKDEEYVNRRELIDEECIFVFLWLQKNND